MKQQYLTVKQLKDILSKLPEDAIVTAYEGEDIGLNVSIATKNGSKYWWISTKHPEENKIED